MKYTNFSLFAASMMMPWICVAQSSNTADSTKAKQVPPSFVVIDKNKDGHVSREEALQAGIPAINFDAADKDKDGRLNLSEWTLIKF